MKLVITEKASVAQSIAKVLGAVAKRQGYLEGGGYLVSWCVGHLVGLAQADAYDPRYGKWRYEDLPILPKAWLYTTLGDKKKQFDILKALMKRTDVDGLIEATDAGREGELIFRLVYQQAGCQKPFQRLWNSSMEDSAILEGFKNLKSSSAYDHLYEAALYRSKADWIVGINATRLFSTLHQRKLTVGRVQTPTLAMLVERGSAIELFQKETYHNLHLECGELTLTKEKIKDRQEAESLLKCCQGQSVTVSSVKTEQKTVSPPHLYDLTTLQREANRYYGYTAQQTLDLAQQLYEKKHITYPRTDSQYITMDMAETVSGVIMVLKQKLAYGSRDDSVDLKRIIDNGKVTDHHAILPTGEAVSGKMDQLSKEEQAIMQLIFQRLLCAVSSKHLYEETEIYAQCAGHEFWTKGKHHLQEGWKGIEKQFKASLKNQESAETEEQQLPAVKEGEVLQVTTASLTDHITSPPKHYTEDTLLAAMESAGKEDFDAETEKKGLGTPATRASIIEKLIGSGYAERKGKQLLPTKDGTVLICILPENLTSPQLTAEWENTLLQIERGKAEGEAFLQSIAEMTQDLVKSYPFLGGDQDQSFEAEVKEIIGDCPRCGKPVYEGSKGFFCIDRACGFALWKENKFFAAMKKQLSKRMASELLKNGRTYAKKLYSARKDRYFEANILMEDTEDGYVKFKLAFPEKGAEQS